MSSFFAAHFSGVPPVLALLRRRSLAPDALDEHPRQQPAVLVRLLRRELQPGQPFGAAPADPHGRAALRVLQVREALRSAG